MKAFSNYLRTFPSCITVSLCRLKLCINILQHCILLLLPVRPDSSISFQWLAYVDVQGGHSIHDSTINSTSLDDMFALFACFPQGRRVPELLSHYHHYTSPFQRSLLVLKLVSFMTLCTMCICCIKYKIS